MKPIGSFSKLVGYGVLAAATFFAAQIEAKTLVNKAVVRAVRGSAQYSAGGRSEWKPVKVGHIYAPNTTIRTAPDSTVDLFLNQNGPVVRVTSDTSLGIDKLNLQTDGIEDVIETQLDLRNGRILGNVKKLASASRYEVKTPRGVAAIRGTEYDISASGVVHCISGNIQVAYVGSNGQVQIVSVGQGQTAVPPSGNQGGQVVQTSTRPEANQVGQGASGFRNETGGFNPNNNPPAPSDSPEQNPAPTGSATAPGARPGTVGPSQTVGETPSQQPSGTRPGVIRPPTPYTQN